MGDDAYERRPTDDEIARMQAVVAEAMDGRGHRLRHQRLAHPQRRPAAGPSPPGWATSTSCGPCSSRSRRPTAGVVALLPGGVISREEVFDLQREVGRPVTWTALLTVKGYPYHEKVVEDNDAARAEGIEVWPQVSCRPLVFQMNLAEPFTLNTRPSFAELMDCPRRAHRRLPRPGLAGRGLDDVRPAGGFPFNWASVSVAESPPAPTWPAGPWSSWPRSGAARPLDVVLDLSLDDDLETRFWSVLANDDPEAIAWLLPRDNVLLGLADSGAHVSQLCDACFATDLLGPWVRERQVMPIERAVHKLTASRPPSTAWPTGAPWRWARPPTCACSTPTRWRRGRCGACTTSRPTGSGSRPTPRWA